MNEAERFIQTIKKSFKSLQDQGGKVQDNLKLIQTQLRQPPISLDQTPSQLMFCRDIRSKLHVMFRRKFD